MHRLLLFEKDNFFGEVLLQIIKNRFPNTAVKWVLRRDECLRETEDFMPDILVLGCNVYNNPELELLDRVREKFLGVSIILFADYDIDEYRREAILRGANHVISKDIWTGNEILALINTLFAAKENRINLPATDSFSVEDFLMRPLERRKKGVRGRSAEQEYLANHPDRRVG